MRPLAVFTVLVGCLLVAGPIRAERISFRVVPDKFDDSKSLDLKIKVGGEFAIKFARIKEKDKEEVLEFQVTVKRKDVPASISRSGRLLVVKSVKERDIESRSNVKPTGRDAEVSFTFRVAAKDVEQARFIYCETERSEVDGHFYTFYLKDFVASK